MFDALAVYTPGGPVTEQFAAYQALLGSSWHAPPTPAGACAPLPIPWTRAGAATVSDNVSLPPEQAGNLAPCYSTRWTMCRSPTPSVAS